MDAYVLDKNFVWQNIIDDFSSFIWTDRFQSCGDFEIYAPMSIKLMSIFQKDYYIQNLESDRLMIIEDIKIETDEDKGDYLTVTGRSLESILDRRIIWAQTIVSGKLQDCVQKLLNENAINPSDSNRKIQNLVFVESTDPNITKLIINSAQYTGDNLYDVICDMCKDHGIGFKITLNHDTLKFEFRLVAGVDRTYNQTDNDYVIFSPEFDNLINSSYLNSKKNLKTVALIAGEGEGNERKTSTVGSGNGLDRRELYVDARDISTKTDDNVDLTAEEYDYQLQQRGYEKMTEYVETNTFSTEADTTTMFIYDEHFTIGDKIQFENDYGISKQVFVSEFIMSQNENGFTSYPTFTDIDSDIVSTSIFVTKTLSDKSIWLKIFHHNNQSGTKLFPADTRFNSKIILIDSDRYSCLNLIPNYQLDGKYEFMLEYPTEFPDQYNRWSQTSNPHTTDVDVASGYTPIHIDWNTNGFGGLTRSASSSNTYLDCSPNLSTCFYAIGAKIKWKDGIPGPNETTIITHDVDLWIRIA